MKDKHYRGMPKSVRVGCYNITVEVQLQCDGDARREFGHMNFCGNKIRLSPGQNPQQLANTFLHECMHAIHRVYGCLDSSTEEDFTHLGANGLCAFWQDNPHAMDWFIRNNALVAV